MKKILIVQGSMKVGGAEKSTVSFLNTLPADKYDIDLMLGNKDGTFLTQVPKWVNIIDTPLEYSCLYHTPRCMTFYFKHNWLLWIKKIIRTRIARKQKKLHFIQSIWSLWNKDIPEYNKIYDVAIGGQQGFTNYYVIDKVRAKRKIIWIHTQYERLNYNSEFDKIYFERASVVATISPINVQSILNVFPHLKKTVWCLENITNASMIRSMSHEKISDIDTGFQGLTIVSCGRLSEPKNYDLAIDAAALLKKRKEKFRWIVVGEGELRGELTNHAKNVGVMDCFNMIGLRSNPYKYMRLADIFVVTSNREGRSIAIDEAKILHKLVVTTNYATAVDVVEHGETGLISEQTPQAIVDSILTLKNNKELSNHILNELSNRKLDNTDEINHYIEAIES